MQRGLRIALNRARATPLNSSPAHTVSSRIINTSMPSNSSTAKVSQAELVKAVMFKAPCGIVDIGANLSDKSFHADRMEVLTRADSMNVKSMVITGVL